MTISDIFGALIERRSYKPPLSGEAAYQILLDMGPKLDKDLVRAFKFVSRLGKGARSSRRPAALLARPERSRGITARPARRSRSAHREEVDVPSTHAASLMK